MKKACKGVLLLQLGVLLSTIAGAQTQSSSDQQKSRGDLAREMRAKNKTQNRSPSATPCEGFPSPSRMSPSQNQESERWYRGEIQALVTRQAFAELDQAAETARSCKNREGGGVWTLFVFYEAVRGPAAGTNATDRDRSERLSLLQNWVAARPQSITARVALAELYRDYAWAERGYSYADQVTESGWKGYRTRVGQAYTTLVEAEKLSAKCPNWYFVMLEVARDQSWDKQKTHLLFERAVSFEPSYYHYYREYALNLLPRWSGEPGDTEAFAEESLRRIGGRQGAFIYLEIAAVLCCLGGDRPGNPLDIWGQPTLSWSKIQQGFAEMEEKYGATMLKLNRFAYLAVLYRDREVAKRILGRIGDNWDPGVWEKRESFDVSRSWAGLTGP